MPQVKSALEPNHKEHRFHELVEAVLQRHMQPEDKFEIAAILESMGWNDRRVTEVFGLEDIFELAATIWDAIQNKILVVPTSPVEKTSPLQYWFRIMRSFLRGTLFALPTAISVASMLTLRLSLWSYMYLSLENATSIALGTILSFMTIGGFTQAIAHRGFMYVGQGHYYIARKLTFYFVKLGYLSCLIGSVFFLLFNTIFSAFPWPMLFIMNLYFLFLSAIWLSVTIMYILQKELAFTGIIAGGILLVFILFRLINLNIIIAQVIALTLVALGGILLAMHFFLQAEKKMEKGIKPPIPRLSIITYTSLPFFAYGFLYFTFLFTDRIIAWSTNSLYMPYLLWFRGEYELGLDIALFVFILPMGLVEVSVNEFMTNLEAHQKNYAAADTQQMNKLYVSQYIKRTFYVALFSILNVVVFYFIFKKLSQGSILQTGNALELNIFINETTHFVFIWALIAYAMVAVALMNILLLFCLAQPEMAYRPTLHALVLNMFLGFVLSRWVHYSWAVFGLFAGSLLLVFLTSRRVLRVLHHLDYYLYSFS